MRIRPIKQASAVRWVKQTKTAYDNLGRCAIHLGVCMLQASVFNDRGVISDFATTLGWLALTSASDRIVGPFLIPQSQIKRQRCADFNNQILYWNACNLNLSFSFIVYFGPNITISKTKIETRSENLLEQFRNLKSKMVDEESWFEAKTVAVDSRIVGNGYERWILHAEDNGRLEVRLRLVGIRLRTTWRLGVRCGVKRLREN